MSTCIPSRSLLRVTPLLPITVIIPCLNHHCPAPAVHVECIIPLWTEQNKVCWWLPRYKSQDTSAVLLATRTTHPITLSSGLSRMAAKYFGSASGNAASRPPQLQIRGNIVRFNSCSGLVSWRLCTNACLFLWSLKFNSQPVTVLTHAAREYRRKHKTLLMSCFNPCKSCHEAGCVSEVAVGLLWYCVDLYDLSLLTQFLPSMRHLSLLTRFCVLSRPLCIMFEILVL